jgi:hypothetical protein
MDMVLKMHQIQHQSGEEEHHFYLIMNQTLVIQLVASHFTNTDFMH